MRSTAAGSSSKELLIMEDRSYEIDFVGSDGKMVIMNEDLRYDLLDPKTNTRVLGRWYAFIFPELLEGTRVIKDGDESGHIDTHGNFTIPMFKGECTGFRDGVSRIWKDGRWGHMDHAGRITIPCVYEDLDYFSEGLAPGRFCGKYGFIDPQDRVVIGFQWDDAHGFLNGLAWVKEGEKWGRIDRRGKVRTPLVFDKVFWNLSNGEALVKKDGQIFFIDEQGRWVRSGDHLVWKEDEYADELPWGLLF